MDALYDLKEKLCKELEKYAGRSELTSGSLTIVDTLAHAAKNVCKIIEFCEAEESGYSSQSYDGASRYGGGSSYRRMSRYSRHDPKNLAKMKLRELMNETEDETVREAIRTAMQQVET